MFARRNLVMFSFLFLSSCAISDGSMTQRKIGLYACAGHRQLVLELYYSKDESREHFSPISGVTGAKLDVEAKKKRAR